MLRKKKGRHVHLSMDRPPPLPQKCSHTYTDRHSFDPKALLHTQLQLHSVLGAPMWPGVSMIHFAFYQRNRSAIKKTSVSHQA